MTEPEQTGANPADDTIAALATGGGGAIACIRVSGSKALEAVSRIFSVHSGKSLRETEPGKMRRGIVADRAERIDEVMTVRFEAPRSYTGEDTVEITCHASPYIANRILSLLIRHGCRAARPGEFTRRAFLNGKMDLLQAEAVADLIASSSAAAHRTALNQMRGGFSMELTLLRARLLEFVSALELELDFGEEEGLVFADRNKLQRNATDIAAIIDKLKNSFAAGNAIKNGVPTAIVGETNAGKSTLLNLLLKDDKAIVSEIPGTTRDVVEDLAVLSGIPFRFFDTAGIRNTDNRVELLGIERTFKKTAEASIVLWIIDARTPDAQVSKLAEKLLPLTADKKLILVVNKIDVASPEQIAAKTILLADAIPDRLFISALAGINADKLEARLATLANITETDEHETTVTSVRHYEALKNASEALVRVGEGLAANIPSDLIAQDVRECVRHLGTIVGAGEITAEEVLGEIFSKFCIGK
ncbi:MAG: tRNA uridine-5-carboxymethylaminomethyl(34) synthesis GTPase MnmE [Prevotellaceae bacterium]|jgi:tRNA modification GTPase|nr:tRNA uridine-5-carboxymethylaminomethyl(34) synthesis GTPase MnmE [Prevotellaceae bacterium]